MSDQGSNRVLTIAGFDPCAGAGVLTDVMTCQQLHTPCMAVTTAITYQDEDKVFDLKWESFDSIKHQLLPLLNRYQFEVVKIGVIDGLALLDGLIQFLKKHQPEAKIIWDPILKASSGFDFVGTVNAGFLKRILNNTYLVTPNKWEWEQLYNALPNLASLTNVLLKGGHNEGEDTSDLLISGDDKIVIKGKRIEVKEKHGTGCILSSAIASHLAMGLPLEEACRKAKKYIESYIKTSETKLGTHYSVQHD